MASSSKFSINKLATNDGTVMHVANTSHSIDWANARVVKMVPGYWERTTEAILIKKSWEPMKLDSYKGISEGDSLFFISIQAHMCTACDTIRYIHTDERNMHTVIQI